jgi:L-aspartate oxidase
MNSDHVADVLVIGGGLAGLSCALRLAQHLDVTVVAKRPLPESATLWAQGGIAAVLGGDDSLASHVHDTLEAGAGLCHRTVVEHTVKHGPENVQWLIDQGIRFSRTPGEAGNGAYHLTREGGHSHRRVIHAEDATGRAVESTLEAQVRSHPRIRLFEEHLAIDLVTAHKFNLDGPERCLGAYVLDRRAGRVSAFKARRTVLATGGAAKVYLYTSNPDTATGDGIAMGWRAGARVANLEFVQFHPTCLYHPQAKSFLISEAVRGEGGKLTLPGGKRFMHRHHSAAELAPRDIVARAIDFEMKRGGFDCVYLDISHKPAEFITEHFPNIYRRCLEFGFDMTREPLPVVPAAHYTCGGVMTDLSARTDIPGLYAVGECTFTGLHGANRLASNSLLECLVFSQGASRHILSGSDELPDLPPGIPPWDESQVTDPDEQIVVSHNWDELRRFMWDYVGIVRTNKRLQRAAHRVDLLRDEIKDFYTNFKVSNDLIELRNLVVVAELIIRSAQTRHECRGLHFTRDFPDRLPDARDTILVPPNFASSTRRETA